MSGLPCRARASSSVSRAEACVQRVRQTPGQDEPARPVHDRHQVKEAALHRDVGDVGAPDMVRPLDCQTPQQIRARSGARGGARWCVAPDRLPEAPSGASDARPGVGRSARPRGAGEVPSDGRRKTGTSGTARRSAASAPASPRSPPSARRRARSARATAGGIAGSGAAPGGRAPLSRGAPTGSSTGPARQKIPLHDQLPDLGVKIADLALMVPDPPLGALREYLDQTLHRLALPGADLVRMDLMLRGDLLQRSIPAKRLQRHLRLQLPRKPASLAALLSNRCLSD